MDMLPYVDSLIKEYFLFRGFNQSFYAFETECESDKSKVFNVEEAVELLLDNFLPNYQSHRMVSFCQFLESNIFSKLETELQEAFKRITGSIYKKYIVNAIQNKRTDKLVDLFSKVANRLRQQPEEWSAWFSIQYVKNPEAHPDFDLYFTKEWSDNLRVSLQNLLSSAFHKVPLPSILRFHLDRLYRRNLQLRVKALEVEKARLETLLSLQNDDNQYPPPISALDLKSSDEKDQLSAYSGIPIQTEKDLYPDGGDSSTDTANEDMRQHLTAGNNNSDNAPLAPAPVELQLENLPNELFEALSDGQSTTETEKATTPTAAAILTKTTSSLSSSTAKSEEAHSTSAIALGTNVATEDTEEGEPDEEEARTLNLQPSDLELHLTSNFAGHEAPITCCRYSPDGENVASSSSDGTIRIWSADDLNPNTRNVTIRTSCKVLCLDWERRREKLVLFGTSLGTVKGWNVDSKRFVFDIEVHSDLTDVISVNCSPCDTLFVVVASTKERGLDRKGSLSLWNSKTFSKVGILSISREEDLDSPVNCVAFSHTGKIIAAGSQDGMVNLYDSSSRNVVAGFPACNTCAIVDIKFDSVHDESVWTLSGKGQVVEWKLSTSEMIREIDFTKYQTISREIAIEDEIAIDPTGKYLASTVGSSGIILKVSEADSTCMEALESQMQSLTSVDWHPSFEQFVLGGEDSMIHTYALLTY